MRSLICTTCLLSWCFEGVFRGGFPVTPLSYINLFRAVYRQKIHLYLVRFSGMLRCWLQRYCERIRTFGTSLVQSHFGHPYYKLDRNNKRNFIAPFFSNEQFLSSIAMKSIPSRVILFYVSSLVYSLFHVPWSCIRLLFVIYTWISSVPSAICSCGSVIIGIDINHINCLFS